MAKIPTDANLLSPMGDLKTAVAIGAIPGWTGFRKFGMNNAVNGSGVLEEIWPVGTPRVLPTTGFQLVLTSDSAEDDPDEATPPGTGAWTVRVEGLDSDWNEIAETITMNGTGNALSTSTDWFRVNRMYNLTAGSNGVNVGNITATLDGNAQAYIEAGEGQTHMAMYSVPAGKTLLVRQYRIIAGRMSGSTDCEVSAYIRPTGSLADAAERAISDIYLWNGASWTNDDSAELIPEKTDTRITVKSTSATQISAVFGGYLIDNRTQGNF